MGSNFTLERFKEFNNDPKKLLHFKNEFVKELDKVLAHRIKESLAISFSEMFTHHNDQVDKEG